MQIFQKSKRIKAAKLPWVFWINISIRRKWFSKWWKTRGSNYVEYQLWIFRISIGRPWIQDVVYRYRKDRGSYASIRETNEANLRQRFAIKIGKEV